MWNSDIGFFDNYNPKVLSQTLMLWNDFKISSSLVVTTGRISQWSDLSGNARHLVQSTATARPVVGTNGVSFFDNTNQKYMNTSGTFGTANNIETFIVMRPNSLTAVNGGYNSIILQGPGYATNVPDFWQFNYGAISASVAHLNFVNTTSDIQSASGLVVTGVNQIYNVNSLGNLREFYKDGTLIGTTNVSGNSTTLPYALFIGGFFNGNTFNGEIMEILMFAAKITAAERTATNNYLKSKWGIA